MKQLIYVPVNQFIHGPMNQFNYIVKSVTAQNVSHLRHSDFLEWHTDRQIIYRTISLGINKIVNVGFRLFKNGTLGYLPIIINRYMVTSGYLSLANN